MNLTVLQLAARWNDARAALARVDEMLSSGGATDLALLPEASLTGYVSPRRSFDLSAFAEPRTGDTARALSSLARRHRSFVAGPLVERDGEALYNALLVFDRAGALVAHYRKRHPWYPETWATPGESAHPTFEIDGVPTTAAICFDVHFLEAEAAGELERARLLLFPSAWVEENDSRAERFTALSVRHGIAVANANWAPGDVSIAGQGGSSIVDAAGRVLARAGRGEERIDAILSL